MSVPAAGSTGWPGVFRPLPKVFDPQLQPGDSIAEADYLFNKTVMLKEEYDATQSCSGSVKSLWVHADAKVVYCFRFRNIGTTSFITLTLVDDQLGTLGPLGLSPPFVPNAAGGFLAYDVPIAEAVTNYATSTLEDDQGNVVVKSDKATVHVYHSVWLPIVLGP